jgi:hypothetical protein
LAQLVVLTPPPSGLSWPNDIEFVLASAWLLNDRPAS